MIRHPIPGVMRTPIDHLIADQLGGADPWLYVMDAALAPRFSLVGTQVAAHTDRGHVLGPLPSSPTARIVRDTVNTIAGSPVLALTYAGFPQLYTTSGGLQGDAPHAMFAVVRKRADQLSPQLGVIGMLGQALGGAVGPLGSSLLGTVGETLTTGGAFGAFTPEGPYPSDVFVLAKRYSGGNTFLYPDGVAVQDPDALTASPTAYTLNLSSGLGFGFSDNSNGCAEVDVPWFGVTRRAPSMFEMQTIIARLCSAFGIGLLPVHIECFGDSLTKGQHEDGTQSTTPYPAVCQADLRLAGYTGAICNNHGNPGYTSDQLLADDVVILELDNNFSLRYPRGKHVSVHFYGTNDWKQPNFGTAEHVINNWILDWAARRRAGFTVCAMTVPPLKASSNPNPAVVLQQNTANDWLRANGVAGGYVAAVGDCESPQNVADFGDLSSDALSGGTHLKDPGYQALGHVASRMLAGVLA